MRIRRSGRPGRVVYFVYARLLSAVLVLLLAVSPALSASVTLQWDANTEPDIAGYKLHYGVTTGNYTTHLDVHNTLARTITGLADGTTYYFAATAYDTVGNESGYSNEVTVSTPSASSETVSRPAAPSGSASGSTGVSYTYSASGAISSAGDTLQYRFLWADGTDSGWLASGATSAAKTWTAAGTYTIQVQARCSLHTSIVSQTSPGASVTIAGAAMETVSAPAAAGGPTAGTAGTAYTYTASGGASSSGHALEYRFSWADGTNSAWLPAASASATKAWSAAGSYAVTVEARCAQHPSIVSTASPSVTVTISGSALETVSQPSAPSGPTSGSTGVSYTYTSGGAVSSTGDGLRYRFDWGDGTTSDWIQPGQQVTTTKSWAVPGTYQVRAEAACASHPDIGAISAVTSVSIFEAGAVAHMLWSSSDTGQAVLWSLDPVSNARQGAVLLGSASGVGPQWLATNYSQVDPSTGTVLWSRSDTGQAVLWKVNSDTGTLISAAVLGSSSGVGKSWIATDYTQVDATTAYVLWTNVAKGQAVLWKIDPSATGGAIQATSAAFLNSTAGVGAKWTATSLAYVDPSTAYVLWTRSDTGQAVLWNLDLGVTGTIPIRSAAVLKSASGVGAKWQATKYVHSDPTTGYVLWTNTTKGLAVLWRVDPSVAGTIPVAEAKFLSPTNGVGKSWQAGGYTR